MCVVQRYAYLSFYIVLGSGLAAAAGNYWRGQRLLPLHPETRGAAMRRNTDGPFLAKLVLRALRGHMGGEQLPEQRDTSAACFVRCGETGLQEYHFTWRSLMFA